MQQVIFKKLQNRNRIFARLSFNFKLLKVQNPSITFSINHLRINSRPNIRNNSHFTKRLISRLRNFHSNASKTVSIVESGEKWTVVTVCRCRSCFSRTMVSGSPLWARRETVRPPLKRG